MLLDDDVISADHQQVAAALVRRQRRVGHQQRLNVRSPAAPLRGRNSRAAGHRRRSPARRAPPVCRLRDRPSARRNPYGRGAGSRSRPAGRSRPGLSGPFNSPSLAQRGGADTDHLLLADVEGHINRLDLHDRWRVWSAEVPTRSPTDTRCADTRPSNGARTRV